MYNITLTNLIEKNSCEDWITTNILVYVHHKPHLIHLATICPEKWWCSTTRFTNYNFRNGIWGQFSRRGVLGFAVLRFWPFFASISWSFRFWSSVLPSSTALQFAVGSPYRRRFTVYRCCSWLFGSFITHTLHTALQCYTDTVVLVFNDFGPGFAVLGAFCCGFVVFCYLLPSPPPPPNVPLLKWQSYLDTAVQFAVRFCQSWCCQQLVSGSPGSQGPVVQSGLVRRNFELNSFT